MGIERFDDYLIPIPCPECNGTIDKSIGWIKHNRKFWCAHCHREIDLMSGPFVTKMRKIDKAIKALEAALLELDIDVNS